MKVSAQRIKRAALESLNAACFLTSVLREVGSLVRFGFVKLRKLSDVRPLGSSVKSCSTIKKSVSFEAH